MQIKRLFCFICLFLKFQTHTHQWLELTSVRVQRQRRQWHPTPVLLPGKSHGRRSLVGCSPWGREELDMTERLPFHFSLSCIGEGNGNSLQCSCLENPRDGGAWQAAIYGVAQSQTRLKWRSSSSSSSSSSSRVQRHHSFSSESTSRILCLPCHKDALLCWDISEFPPTSSLAVSWPH